MAERLTKEEFSAIEYDRMVPTSFIFTPDVFPVYGDATGSFYRYHHIKPGGLSSPSGVISSAFGKVNALKTSAEGTRTVEWGFKLNGSKFVIVLSYKGVLIETAGNVPLDDFKAFLDVMINKLMPDKAKREMLLDDHPMKGRE